MGRISAQREVHIVIGRGELLCFPYSDYTYMLAAKSCECRGPLLLLRCNQRDDCFGLRDQIVGNIKRNLFTRLGLDQIDELPQ